MKPPGPATVDAEFSRRLAALAAIHGQADSRAFAANLSTSLDVLAVNGMSLPVTVNHGGRNERRNAWVCSPLTSYGPYAVEESVRNLHPLLGWPLAGVCGLYSHALRLAHIDRAVALNNWMLSTNLYPAYPALNEVALPLLIDAARQRWPGHALWFRSLNRAQNADWLDALAALGFVRIPSRQVYLFDDVGQAARQHQNLRRDLSLLRATSLKRVASADFHEADYARIAVLYGQLYLQKYSRLNPQYTAQFMQRWHHAGLLSFHGFKDGDGVLQAVVGIFRQGNALTAPIVGYNTALPQAMGLYRLLMACVFDEAMRSGATVNLSAGAASFKRLRGGRPVIEYSAVLATHMPAATRAAIALLQRMATSVGLPLMQRLGL